MANIDNAYTIDMLSLDDNVLIVSGISDPTINTGFEAPIGSLYLRTNGSLYQKFDTANVDWKLLSIDTNLISDIQTEIDNIETASGGIFDTDGTYNGTLVDTQLSNVSASTSLLNTLSQLDSAITIAGGPIAFNDLTDVTLTTPLNGQTIIYNNITSQWENVTLTTTSPGSGRLLQVQFNAIPALSGTVSIPLGTTDPLITQGVPLWSQTITPIEATSNIRIGTSVTASGSRNNTNLLFTFFRNSICIGAGIINMMARNSGHPFNITIYDSPNATTPITYSCRVGKISGNAWYINRLNNASLLNGQLAKQAYTVEEIGVVI